MKFPSTKMLACWLLLLPATLAHTWVEELLLIAPNGTMVGTPGYPRSYMSRMQNGFEPFMTYLLPPNDGRANELLPTDPICKPSQTIGNQPAGFPALVASPGDNIALRYQENGHVTLPNGNIGKPANRGTVYIYGTTQPSNTDKILDIHKVWNAAGTGGDGRGVLLATRNYDDGQCYQSNPASNISVARAAEFASIKVTTPLMGVNLWCQSDVQLPSNVTGNNYTLYWVWDWPTAPNVTGSGQPNGLVQLYTTCMDITMQPASSSNVTAQGPINFIANQTIDYAAIPDQLSNAFQVTEGTSTASGTAAVQTATTAVAQTATTAVQSSTSSAANGDATVMVTHTVTVTQVQTPAMVTSYVAKSATVAAQAITSSTSASEGTIARRFRFFNPRLIF